MEFGEPVNCSGGAHVYVAVFCEKFSVEKAASIRDMP
jgi:hypothetical protein